MWAQDSQVDGGLTASGNPCIRASAEMTKWPYLLCVCSWCLEVGGPHMKGIPSDRNDYWVNSIDHSEDHE